MSLECFYKFNGKYYRKIHRFYGPDYVEEISEEEYLKAPDCRKYEK